MICPWSGSVIPVIVARDGIEADEKLFAFLG